MIPFSGSPPWAPDHPRTLPRIGVPTPRHGASPESACGNGAMSRVLEQTGNRLISSDLYDRGFGEVGHDFLTTRLNVGTLDDASHGAHPADAGRRRGWAPSGCGVSIRVCVFLRRECAAFRGTLVRAWDCGDNLCRCRIGQI